ncbi:hypothetical protein CRG98_007702 [Punica granatum]|uniref:Uncharacterized protein n=1 Tax=Punica granatum TaxID=22663 RepID=A0A2I0KTY8_PUNGR|nr:hypothetical protein CRG98_007702 [Punica granatum]
MESKLEKWKLVSQEGKAEDEDGSTSFCTWSRRREGREVKVQRVDGSEVDGDGIAMNKKQSCKLSVATLFLRLQSKGREW